MILSIIASFGEKNENGKKNNLLCHLPKDLKHFRDITLGHTIIMGRKTFDSLPNGSLPLRRNIVISRNQNLKIKNAEIYNSLETALLKLIKLEEIFIIGGVQIFQQTLPFVSRLYLTKIHSTFPDADTFFPTINYNEWNEIEHEKHLIDAKNPYSFSFIKYEKK